MWQLHYTSALQGMIVYCDTILVQQITVKGGQREQREKERWPWLSCCYLMYVMTIFTEILVICFRKRMVAYGFQMNFFYLLKERKGGTWFSQKSWLFVLGMEWWHMVLK